MLKLIKAYKPPEEGFRHSGVEEHNLSLLKLVTRLTVLVMLTIFSAWFNAFFTLKRVNTSLALCIDAVINMACAILCFKYYNKSFKRYCCCCRQI